MSVSSFRLDKKILFLLCMKIIHSIVIVGIYFGFLTTFSIGPFFLIFFFLLKFNPIEEGINKRSIMIAFLTGQFIMLISIFYAPLHRILSRSHIITFLDISYLLFQLFRNNKKVFFDYGLIPTFNSMCNFIIKYILNNIILQFFILFFFFNSMFSRVINIFLFRCNNNILFLINSFIGWLICFIIFTKWIELVYYRSKIRNFFFFNTSLNNLYIRLTNKISKFVAYYSRLVKKSLLELINVMSRIFSFLFFITCIYSLVKIPSPILNQKWKETTSNSKIEKMKEYKEVEIEKSVWFQNLQEKSTNDTFHDLFSEEMTDRKKKLILKKNNLDENITLTLVKQKYKEDKIKFVLLRFEQTLVTLLFDYQQWNRPLRYIKNYQLEKNIRKEMSQYFFYISSNDGKLKISFTYSSSLLTFLEIIQIKIYLSTIDIFYFNLKNGAWKSINEKKKSKQSNDFLKRMNYLDKKYHFKKILAKKIRLCFNNDKIYIYLTNIYDPFATGSYRGRTKKNSSSYNINETFFIENSIDIIWRNKIHNILLPDYRQIKQNKIYKTVDQKLLKVQKLYFLICISPFYKKEKSILNFFYKSILLFKEEKSTLEKKDFQYQKKYFNILKKIITEFNNLKRLIKKKSIGVQKICKKIPKRSYKLIDELEQQLGEIKEVAKDFYDIRSRKAKRIVIYTDNSQKNYSYYNTLNIKKTLNSDQVDEVALLHYLQQSDFRREIIKGTIRTQRRKTVILELCQVNTHSLLFLEKKSKIFFFQCLKQMIFILINKISQNLKLKNYHYRTEKERKLMEKKEEKVEEKIRIEIAEAWDTILFAQGIRGFMLIIQSIFRKNIFLPLLIIVKNFFRILLFQLTEWSEDFKKCKKEMHVKCTYNGVQLSENEFPKNWLTDGMQIKILFPFYLKPWNRSRLRSSYMDIMKKKREKEGFCFLTVWGMESELSFGSPRKQPSFFEPIFKTLKKKIIKLIKKKFFIILGVLKEKKFFITHFFLKIFRKIILFKIRIKNFSSKNQKILFFGLKEDLSIISETKEEINLKKNRMIYKLSIIRFLDSRKDLLIENKIKDLMDRRNIIQNQIKDLIKKDKKKEFIITSNIKLNFNKKSTIKKIVKSPKNIQNILKKNIEKSYIDFFLCKCININSNSFNTQLFLDSTKKIIKKISSKKNQTIIHLMISTLKKSMFILNCNKNSSIYYNLSFSQTYVFYKFSKIQILNLYKFRYIFSFDGTSFFIKKKIKDFFVKKDIFHSNSKLRIKFLKSKKKQWNFWFFRAHYQYDLSPIRWSRLSRKWQSHQVVNKYCTIFYFLINKCDFLLLYFYNNKKVQLIYHYKKIDYEELSLLNKKENLKKNDFNRISYKFLNYEYKNFIYLKKKLPLYVRFKNKMKNYNAHKRKVLDRLKFFYKILRKNDIRDIDKYLNFYKNYSIQFFFQKFYLSDINTSTNSHYLILIIGTNHSVMDLIFNQKDICYFTIDNKNVERLKNYSRLNTLWFFPEFFLFYNEYKMKPWIIPIELLQFLHLNEIFSEKKTISLKKKFLKLENIKKEKESNGKENISNIQNQDSIVSNQIKLIEDLSVKSNRQKLQKKQYKNHTEIELDLLLKNYFFFQLRWYETLNIKIINNIKVYCLLLRLINPKYMILSSIQRREFSLNIMFNKNIFIKELIKSGILIIEPFRLSIKKNRKFIIVYQIVVFSLVQKNTNQEKINVDLIFKLIEKNKKVIETKNKINNIYFIPENIFSIRHNRKVRIRILLYSRNYLNSFNNRNITIFKSNNFKNFSKRFKNINQIYNLKLFFWINYQLEDLICVNRYWFDTYNGSRFSLLRICR